VTRSKIPY